MMDLSLFFLFYLALSVILLEDLLHCYRVFSHSSCLLSDLHHYLIYLLHYILPPHL